MTLTHAMRSGLSMARKPRFVLQGVPQHVIQPRGKLLKGGEVILI